MISTVFIISLFLLAASPLSDEKIVARVNDTILTTTEFNQILQPQYRQFEQMISGWELRQKKEEIRRETIKDWVNKQLILQEARSMEDFQIDPMEVDKRFEETVNQFSTREEFEKVLAAEGLDEEEFRKNLEDQIKVRFLTRQNVTSTIVVSPGEIIEYYNQHKDDYQEAEKVRISHILIPASPGAPNEDVARARAEEVLEKIEAGEDFAELAREYSKGPLAEKGGDMGYFKKGEMMAALDAAAFELEVGEHSDLIRTDLGYHIILNTGRKEASRRSLDELWGEIEDELFQKRFQAKYDEWIEDLKSKAYVVIEEK